MKKFEQPKWWQHGEKDFHSRLYKNSKTFGEYKSNLSMEMQLLCKELMDLDSKGALPPYGGLAMIHLQFWQGVVNNVPDMEKPMEWKFRT